MEIPKLKVPNVSILLIFMIFTICSHSQISGTYCLVYELKDFSTCLKFNEDGTFEYEQIGHLGVQQYGKGDFRISRESLTLDYGKTKPKKATFYRYEFWDAQKDSIILNFKVMDLNSNIMPNSSIIVDLEKEIGLKTGSKGLAKITLKKSEESNKIIINSLGYNTSKFKLQKSLSYYIEIYLAKTGGIPIKDKIEYFEIIENNDDSLKIKDKTGKVILWERQ